MCKYCNNTFENKPVNGECLLETKWTERFAIFLFSLMQAGILSLLLYALLQYLDFFLRDMNTAIIFFVWFALFLSLIIKFAKGYQPIFLVDDSLHADEETIFAKNKFLLLKNKVKYRNGVYAIPKRFRQSPHDLVEFLNCNEWKKK